MHGMKRGLRSSFQISPPIPSNLGSYPLVIQSSQVPPFSLSRIHMIPWNSLNGETDEGHIWVGSTIQINRKQDASNRDDFEQ